ncbi:hypothetical protein BDW71DRAFT_173895 [Aspergillus fruticulosus]
MSLPTRHDMSCRAGRESSWVLACHLYITYICNMYISLRYMSWYAAAEENEVPILGCSALAL